MSESGEKKDLGGLARSIDSLFGGREGSDAERSDTDEVAEGTKPDVETAEASWDGDEVRLERVDAVTEAVAPEPVAEVEGFEPTEIVDAPEPIGVRDTVEGAPVVGIGPEVHTGRDVDTRVERPPPVPEAPSASERSTSSDDEGRAAAPEAEGGAPATAPEEDPGPLVLAVESFLAGGGDDHRVRTLGEQAFEARRYNDVAVAVERLVLGATGPLADEAMELAEALIHPLVLSRIAQRLGYERAEEKRSAYHDICRRLGPRMAQVLRDEMAESPDRHARRAYFDALVAMWDMSRPVVEAMAEDDNRFLARNAIAILGEVGGEDAVPLVNGALANTDPRVRREALLALARLGVDDADDLVVGRLVDDTEESVRQAAVVAAGELRVERAVRPLVARLDESYEPDDVLPVLHALGQIADPGAVTSIEKHAVRDRFGPPRTDVRIAAYQALAHIGTPHARRLLNQALEDKDPGVRQAVKRLLKIR